MNKLEHSERPTHSIDRRGLMKLGASALVAQAMSEIPASAQQSSGDPYKGVQVVTKTGWKNDANRASGNGPLDEETRQIVKYVSSLSPANMGPPILESIDNTVIDTIAALIAGYGSEPTLVAARLAKTMRGEPKATAFGYGFTTTLEMATFTNSCMTRFSEFNDNPHNSDMICASFAVGEALHCTGLEVMQAIAISYEVVTALGRAGGGGGGGGLWDGPFNSAAVAMAVGKLMKLNEDQLANALSLALVPHMPMFVTHVGALSMWKGCHAPEAARCGVFAAMLAQAGMTGPGQPFEARQGLFDHDGPFRNFRIPASPDGRTAIQVIHEGGGGFKRSPAEGNSQAILESIPDFRKFCKPEEIASIRVDFPFGAWQEIADPPKWDPRNHETADHSLAYILARALLDGRIYVDSFTREKFMDPKARRLMEVTTAWPNNSFKGHQYRMTVRTTDGRQLVKEIGAAPSQGGTEYQDTPMSRADILAKFHDICAFKGVTDGQRDQILAAFSNLRTVKNFAESVKTLYTFGPPIDLSSDRSML